MAITPETKIGDFLAAHPDQQEALLATGEHLLAWVRRVLLTLAPGEALQLLSPFRPEPLLDQFRQEGTPCWCEAEGTGRFRTWILKPRESEQL